MPVPETVAYNRAVQAAPASYGPGRFKAVTKSDTEYLPAQTRGLWIGGVGDVAVQGVYDSLPVTLLAVAAGTFIPGRFARVWATNTSATNIIAFYQ